MNSCALSHISFHEACVSTGLDLVSFCRSKICDRDSYPANSQGVEETPPWRFFMRAFSGGLVGTLGWPCSLRAVVRTRQVASINSIRTPGGGKAVKGESV